MEEKCGCYSKVFVETNAEKIETFRVEIFYCPLHAAAPLMLEALRFYADPGNYEWFDGYADYEMAVDEDKGDVAQAAIAAAEPTEVK